MSWLRTKILNWLLEHPQLDRLLETPAQTLERVLTAEELRLIRALRAPDRWQPDPEITPEEADMWAGLLRSPLMQKIDVAMVNMAQQQAQIAIHETPQNVSRAAGYAAGFRGGWQMAKSISTLVSAKTGETEKGADTATAGLEHLNP